MYKARVSIWLLITLVVLGAAIALTMPKKTYASSGINQELSFEGKIVNSAGINIPDGIYNMEFKIYQGGTATGGGALVWTEDWLVGSSPVTFSSGTFQANLGAVAALPTNIWNTYPLYLSLQVGSTGVCTPAGNFTANCAGTGEMSPYILLTSTPYAFNAAQLGGLSSSGYVQTAPGATQQIQPTIDAVGLKVLQSTASSPTADIFDIQTANTTNVLQITGSGANTSNVIINAVGAGNNVTINPSGTGTLNLGTVATANTIQIGSLTLASGTQTINIGNDNTAGGTTNVVIGDGGTSTGGTTTIQAQSSITQQVGSASQILNSSGDTIKTSVTNSTTAFQLQNASGANLITADTQNGSVLISNGTNQTGGVIGSWNTTTALLTALSFSSTVYSNGYVYKLGGSTTGLVGGAVSTTYYAPVNANGSLGAWNTTTALPSSGTGVWGGAADAFNGYVYEWGGTNSAGAMQTTVYFAQINSNGSLGAWVAAGNNPASATFGDSGLAYKGYLYQIGSATSSSAAGATATSYFAPISANGTVGVWSATSALPAARYLAKEVTYNGNVYFVGGENTAGVTQTSIYYAQLNGAAGLGTFNNTTTSLSTAVGGEDASITNGYLDVYGGTTTGAAAGNITTTYIAPITNSGNITGAFTTTTPLTTALYGASGFTNNGNVYEIGGINTGGSSVTNNNYAYVFNGSAGNYAIVNANGTNVATSTNSTSTFQVQNATGLSMIQVDSLNGQVILSNGNNSGGTLSAYWSNSTVLTTAVSYAATVSYNGYVYQLGGSTGAGNACATGATSPTNLTYYAPVNSSGAVGSWTAGSVLTTAVCGLSAAAYNGYMYEWGGSIAAGTIQTNVYSAPINANGSFGAWTLAGNNPAAGPFGNVGVAYNGYLYQVGSATTDTAAGATTATAFTQITGGGTVGVWSSGTVLTGARYMASIALYNGIVYAIGGDSTAGAAQTTIYYSTLSAGFGAWSTATTTLTTGYDAGSAVIQNGYLQILGGTTTNAAAGAVTNTYGVPIGSAGNITGTFVATTPLPNAISTHQAVYINGNILVVGGVNTAGTIVPSIFYVQANSGAQNSITTNNQGVTVASTTNSTASLQVQNASGNSLLTVDTQDGYVEVGSGAAGDTIGYTFVLDSKNTAGDPTGVAGAMYYNASSSSFRCYESGLWQNCLNGLIGASAAGAAINNCTAACGAISTGTSFLPANYCVAGRVITIVANGVYSTAGTPSLALSVYVGTNATKASDTLLGAAANAATVGTNATNLGWSMNATIYCVSTTSAWFEGTTQILTSAAGAGVTSEVSATTPTAITNTNQNLYIFPAWGTATPANTITTEQFIVTGS